VNVESQIACPHCGANFSILIDTSQGAHSMIEDCSVCCRPILIEVRCEPGEIFEVRATAQ
jgi:hypothetical protein